MNPSSLSILVIEDNPLDFKMLKRGLGALSDFELFWTKSLGEGLALSTAQTFDITLLDLSLPDSDGLETVEAFTQESSNPVVVLSGLADEELALKAVQHGAQDYLVKGQYDTPMLVRTIRYATERYQLIEELNESRQEVKREQELRRLERTADDASAQEDASQELKPEPQKPLSFARSDIFEYAVSEYRSLLHRALEKRGYKVEYNMSQLLKVLAELLGSHKALPKDVLEMHTVALTAELPGMQAQRSRLCNEEARYLLAGLMGHLVSYYRSHCSTLPTALTIADVEQQKQIWLEASP